MRSLDLIILKVPLSSDAVWSFRHENHTWNVTSSDATISSHDLQELCPDGPINLADSFQNTFKHFSYKLFEKLSSSEHWGQRIQLDSMQITSSRR